MIHDNGHAYGPAALCASASATLFGAAGRLWAMHGFDPTTIAALAGGLGTLIMALVNASKEARAWLDRRAAAREARP